MAHQRRDVDPEPAAERLRVVLEGLPGPLEGALEGGVRHLLDLLEHAHQAGPVGILQRGQRQRAVARDHRGDAVLQRRPGLAVPEQLDIEVGVRIDEARRHHPAGGVDLAGAVGDDAAADAADPAVLDPQITDETGQSGAVDDPAVPDDQIHCSLPSR